MAFEKYKPRDLFYGICKEQQICANPFSRPVIEQALPVSKLK